MAEQGGFGSGLDFTGTSTDIYSGGANPSPGSAGAVGSGIGADVPLAASAPATPPVQNANTASAFGSGLVINPAGPDAQPLDMAENILRQRVQHANDASTGVRGVIIGILDPDAKNHNLALVQQGTEALQKIQTQKAVIAQNRQEAANLGLAPGEVSEYATREARVQAAQQRAIKGDLKSFQGLMTIDPKAADAIADQVHESVAGHLSNAQFAYDKLSNMTTQGEYSAAVRDLQHNGVLKDIQALGFKVPDTLDAFNSAKAGEGLALRNARISLDGLKNKLEARNTYQPMEKKEAESWDGRITTAYGDQVKAGVWSRNAASGTPGFVVNGMADPRQLGKSFTLGDNDQRKAVREEFETAVPKQQLEKFREFNRTYQLATHDEKGNLIDPKSKDPLNTNPNVQQGIAEGLASMLRGGSGGANVGLLKIETGKRAAVQNLIDTIKANYAGGINTLTGEQVRSYMTTLTQSQIRDVMDVIKGANDASINERGGRIMERAGALGFDSSVFGLGKGEYGGGIDDAMQSGRQAQIDRMMNSHQAIGGGDGVLQVGAQRPGAGAASLPPGAQPSNQLPGSPPVATPVQQAAGAVTPPPAGPAPSGTPSPRAPAAAPGGEGGEGGGDRPPGPQDPVHVQLQGVSSAVQQWLTDKGVPPGPGMQKQVQAVLTNPRIEKALESGKPIEPKTIAAALGKGGDKSVIQKIGDFLNAHFMQGVPEGEREQAAAAVGKAATDNAPAIGSTVGGVGGFMAGGPAGGVAGGAAGGAAGQVVQDYIRGNPQDPLKIGEQAALGGVLGVMSEARPVVATAARVAGAGAVEGGAAAARGDNAADAVDAGLKGAGSAVLGEAFGRALGMAGHKVWSLFSSDAKAGLENAAKSLSEARQTLETTEPKIAGANGTAAVDNPAYVQAERAVEKAETTIKDAGLKPEDVEYAYKVSQDKVPTGEATMNRPGELEKQRLGQQYTQMREDVRSAGVGAPKAAPSLNDGPIAAAASMSPTLQNEAKRVEMAITAPAQDWGHKWQQLQDARSSLLTAERDALGSTSPHKQRIADDYRTLADAVRVQQEKAAKYVFGEEGGKQLIERLKDVDRKYAILNTATNGGDLERAARMTGEKGRDADKAFRAFAGEDKEAIAAWDALREANKRNGNVEKDVRTLVGAEKIPVLGHLISASKLLAGLNEWRAAKAANAHADFGAMLGLKPGSAYSSFPAAASANAGANIAVRQ